MTKEELQQLRRTVHYETSDSFTTNDTLFNGIILKSFNQNNSVKNHCYLIDENTKTKHHISSHPMGFVNRTPGLTLAFKEEKDINKVIPTQVHYTIFKFDEPRTLLQISNEIII